MSSERCGEANAQMSRIRAARIARDTGPSAAFRKGVGMRMHAPRSEALRLGPSDALPCGRKPDPRHVCPSRRVRREMREEMS